MDILEVLQKIRTVEQSITRKKKALLKLQNSFNLAMASFTNYYKVPCIRAFTHYNDTAHYRIDITRSNILLEESKMRINLYLRLLKGNGLEPIDMLRRKDIADIEKALAPYIERELREDEVPLTFGYICVPNDYYK